MDRDTTLLPSGFGSRDKDSKDANQQVQPASNIPEQPVKGVGLQSTLRRMDRFYDAGTQLRCVAHILQAHRYKFRRVMECTTGFAKNQLPLEKSSLYTCAQYQPCYWAQRYEHLQNCCIGIVELNKLISANWY